MDGVKYNCNLSINCDNKLDNKEFSECCNVAKTIKPIDRMSVDRICSGQVVQSFATAVKELVENSIDAGASIVDVRLKEFGSDSVDVSDNGTGVEEKNFCVLTQKHCTSKLVKFSDLTHVETFGFRGEALSSLCALSDMVISTRHSSVEIGTRLEFSKSGRIVSSDPFPRQTGTSVTLRKIFHTLPVRHREFLRNLKREFTKMVHVLNSYCIVSTGVRITCSNQTGKRNKTVVVSTNGNQTIEENISNVYGSKQLHSLLPFKQLHLSPDVCAECGIDVNAAAHNVFHVIGFVSTTEHGQGRSSTDRQFVFINRRPCDSLKVIKVTNEVYRSYNRTQYPFIVLLVSTGKESVDVNVTPDKHLLLMEGEKALLAMIKISLIKMFEPSLSTVKLNHVGQLSVFPERSNASISDSGNKLLSGPVNPDRHTSHQHENKVPDIGALLKLKRPFSSPSDMHREDTPCDRADPSLHIKERKLETVICWKQALLNGREMESQQSSSFPTAHSRHQYFHESPSPPSLTAEDTTEGIIISPGGVDSEETSVDVTDEPNVSGCLATSDRNVSSSGLSSSCDSIMACKNGSESLLAGAGNKLKFNTCSPDFQNCFSTEAIEGGDDEHLSKEVAFDDQNVLLDTYVRGSSLLNSYHGDGHCHTISSVCSNVAARQLTDRPDGPAFTMTVTDVDTCALPQSIQFWLDFSITKLRQCLMSSASNSKPQRKARYRSFRARITPSDNSSAELELKRELSKDMFSQMKVVGQFNVGFVIAQNGKDLFIVDQHASDEKYNFEMLRQHTVLQSQPLICPQYLDLTASSELILLDNLSIFEKNGFDFVVDNEAPPTKKVKLKTMPVSWNWSFGKEDIEELIFMLTESPGEMCRPSRVRMMLASRACRKSIMIGTHLSHREMRKLLRHMGDLEQPWNCPHGRPTIRHLVNLGILPE